MTRREFLGVAAAALASLGIAPATASAYRFVVERSTLRVDGLARPLRLVILSDLHLGPFIRRGSVRAWIDATLAERADLVLLVGDLVDQAAGDDVAPLLDELARLDAPLGAYAVWGNHDHASRVDLDAFERGLAGAGVEVLVNRGVDVGGLHLAGLDDLRSGRPDLGRTLAKRAPDRPCVLLSHNPDVLPTVPTDVALTVAGHTHGGQVCPPGIGPIVTSSRYGRRFASGWVRGPARGYVSRGLGVSVLPVRIGCPAELAVVELRPGARAEGAARPPAGRPT